MKKDNLSKKLLALSLLGTLTLAHPEATEASQNFNRSEVTFELVPTITAITNVNVRESASTNSRKIGTLAKNQSLRLYEEYAGWYKVGYGNTFGYVNKQYAYITSQTKMNQTALSTFVTNKNLSLYSDESCTKYIGFVPANTVVSVYLDNPYTYYVKYGNLLGYISKNQINTNNNNIIYNNSLYYEVPAPNYDYNNTVYNDYVVESNYDNNVYYDYVPQNNITQNNYYGNVENNYYTYYEDNSKVLVRK